MHRPRILITLLQLFLLLVPFILAQQDSTCDSENPCKVGCCSNSGSCGFGPDWCGKDNCQSNCTAVAECGQYGGGKECPLNVCCSRWGFCGTTTEFCTKTSSNETSCQSNCGQPERQKCNSKNWKQRRIAYYETWADTRDCDAFRPENIPVKALTHLNIAFGGIQDSRVTIDNSDMISRIVKLKRRNRSLKIFIAIGGWAFSDPGPTRTAWSDMASTKDNRTKFIKSLMDLLETFNLDGVDLDWEYPVADDRGGKDDDYKNYVSLLKEMRQSFGERDSSWDISMAIPASYWYLQHFDISALEKEVSWFNLMSYDMRGKWDRDNEWTGPYVFGHTNITEIERGVDLLRRNNVNLFKVSLGMGFYGRTFTLADPKCNTPGCVFSEAGLLGECSGEAGILTFKEIMARQHRLNEKTIRYDEDSGVKYMVYDETQWITYDDEESFKAKRKLLDEECFGGVMIWAIDQDTPDFQALTGLLGDEFMSDALLEGGELSDEEKEALVDEMGGLTGDGCYVTTGCVGAEATIEGTSKCNSGDVSVGIVHSPGESYHNMYGLMAHNAQSCSLGQYKRICCPAKSPAVNCNWVGTPESGSSKCTGGEAENTCGKGRYELLTDRYADTIGQTKCSSGLVSLCCDAAPELEDCYWTSCTVFHKCSTGYAQPIATRGDFCKDEGSAQNLCCKLESRLKNCDWVPPVEKYKEDGDITLITLPTMEQCAQTQCPSTKFTAAKAKLPDRSAGKRAPCEYYYPGMQHRLCCDPNPDLDLPFDLKKIFAKPIQEDVLYRYTDNYGNNDHDPHGADEMDVGDDPYGFIVLDGDEDALQGEFPSNFVVAHVEDGTGNPIRKRETLTRDNPDVMDWVFEHEESSHLVYCRPGREEHCEKVFKGGAADTIIGLPPHIGSGPYARIVSMEPVEDSHLSSFHKAKRSENRHDSTVYNLTIDYRFELIRREDSTVNLRIDYTNLVPYWDEMTGEESDAGKTKRELRREKRWWGGFPDWLAKLTTVRKSDQGKLPLSIHKKMLLYSRRAQCARKNTVLRAGIDVTLDAKFDMNARWAYYAQGTIVPMNVDTVYTYFELEPEVQAVIEVEGSAEMQYNSPRIKIIDTLSYPGLAIKGIAAVGPTLDLWAGMAAGARVAGKLTAGAKVTFPRYEMYFPQTDDATEYQQFPTPDKDKEKRSTGTDMVPILDASVEASVNIDFKITPEVNLGIKVNAPIKKGGTIVDAQIVGFVNNTLRFQVDGKAAGGVDNPPAASYSIFIKYFYNFGIGGRAVFKWLGEYALKPQTLWNGLGREKILWEHHGSTAVSKRSPFVPEIGGPDRFIPLYNESLYLENDWSGSSSHLAGRSLAPRSTLEDVAAFGDEKGFFTCNDGGQCASGDCAGQACEWKPKDSNTNTKRADDDDGDPMDVDPQESCVGAIPAMMYNCKYFPDMSAGGRPIHGICRNILKYMDSAGLGTGPFSATFSTYGSSDDSGRREMVCGYGSKHKYTIKDENDEDVEHNTSWSERCVEESKILSTLTGTPVGVAGNENWLSCDEFPFNSLEEGGNPTSNSRTCVPGYQQNIQSNLNKLPQKIEQEIEWIYNDQGETKTAFKKWSIDWLSASARGRLVNPDKNTAWNWAQTHKKSFTFHLFNSDSTTTPMNTNYEVFNHDIVAESGYEGTIGNVVAAVNLLDNPKYKYNGNNAWCKKGNEVRDHRFWGTAGGGYVRVTGCKVKFNNGAAAAKIKRGEEPTQEELFNVKSIEIDENAPEILIPIPGWDAEANAAELPEEQARIHRHLAKHTKRH